MSIRARPWGRNPKSPDTNRPRISLAGDQGKTALSGANQVVDQRLDPALEFGLGGSLLPGDVWQAKAQSLGQGARRQVQENAGRLGPDIVQCGATVQAVLTTQPEDMVQPKSLALAPHSKNTARYSQTKYPPDRNSALCPFLRQ